MSPLRFLVPGDINEILYRTLHTRTYDIFRLLWYTMLNKNGRAGPICMYRARQKGVSQVARILQARPGRSGKQEQEQNSRNLGTAFLPNPVHSKSLSFKLPNTKQALYETANIEADL